VIRPEGGTPYAQVEGDVDIGSAPVLQAMLEELAGQTNEVVISFERCTYLDSSALNVLVSTQKALSRQNATRFVLVIPRENRIRRIFAVSGLDEAFDVVDDLASARIRLS